MAHPSLLRELVERCETLRRRTASGGNAETVRQLEDTTRCAWSRAPTSWTRRCSSPVAS
ncbi:DUF5133 domain-containing protein [Streptomyces sp. NBC_01538]|uniref:DUF5133 domain-containing protein n=1 Tax=Streptomyces sp. NBC_01538 TaxID=2903897 RepID=UPI00386B6493